MRALIILSGVIFAVSAVMRAWELSMLAIAVMIVAQVYGLVAAKRDAPTSRIRELLKHDGKPKP